MLQKSESKASARDADRKPQSSAKRISVEIKDGEVSVAEPLPAGVSLRIELILEEPEARRAVASTIAKSELRQRSRVARGSSPLPTVGEARERMPAAEPEAPAVAEGDDEVDFDEKPTFELDKSQLESLARGASLPLSPPPAAPRAGNQIPPVSGTTESLRTLEAPLAKPDDLVEDHVGEARERISGGLAARAQANPPAATRVVPDDHARRGTGIAIDPQRRERAIVLSLIVALVAAFAAIAALLLR
jgi:hypothetical protein